MEQSYKEKYEKALERARVWKDKSGMPKNKQGILDDIFPELAESEDEKIKHEIKVVLANTDFSESALEYTFADMIAWLEKQGKRPSIWTDNDRIMAFTLLRDVDQMTYISEEGKNERLQWLNSLEDKFNNGE